MSTETNQRRHIFILLVKEARAMADWKAIYERAEDMELERLRKRAERRKAKQEQQVQKDFSQDTTGTTTTSKEEKPHD